jgi:hypothetical protein
MTIYLIGLIIVAALLWWLEKSAYEWNTQQGFEVSPEDRATSFIIGLVVSVLWPVILPFAILAGVTFGLVKLANKFPIWTRKDD